MHLNLNFIDQSTCKSIRTFLEITKIRANGIFYQVPTRMEKYNLLPLDVRKTFFRCINITDSFLFISSIENKIVTGVLFYKNIVICMSNNIIFNPFLIIGKVFGIQRIAQKIKRAIGWGLTSKVFLKHIP